MSKPDKKIIQRLLSLTQRYTLIDKKYIPLLDGGGCTCQNCGTLIANIATVRAENGQVYDIGFDCLETFLINNSLLDSAGVEEYERVKKMIPKILRAAKQIKETIQQNKAINITGILLEKPMFENFFMVDLMLLGLCFSTRFRAMNDEEVGIWVRAIFEKRKNKFIWS